MVTTHGEPQAAIVDFETFEAVRGAVMRLLLWKRAIARDPAARTYKDLALTPVCDDEDMTLYLLTKTTGARAAVAHVKRVAELTGGARVA